MATSLAQQLQGIRQSAANVNFQKRKKVASLLFDSSEAADQDYDQVFAIASNGFEELVTYDVKLSSFSRTIFSDESRFIDRYTQTQEQNDSLDRKLVAFVKASAPYFQLRPTQKCLEWLIRRFDVHVLLAETLILTYLPFHTTPTFSKLLSILEVPQAWSFLGAVRKAGESPHITLLVKAFVKTPALLSLFLEHVQTVVLAGQSFHNLISIYADISVRCITTMRDNKTDEDSIYARFLPFIGEGVSMRNHTEYQVANYMVLIVLSATRTMSPETTKAVMAATAQGLTTQSQKSGLLCLAQLCQTTEGNIVPLSSDIFHAIVANAGYLDVLLELGEKYRAERFLTAFAISAITETTTEALELAQRIVATGRSSIAAVLNAIAQQVMASADMPEFRNACASFLESLQQQSKYYKVLTTFYESLGSSIDDLELALQITLDVPSSAEVAPKLRRQSSSRPNISLEDEIAELPALSNDQNYLSVGDVRRTINVLQMAASLGRFAEVLDSPVVSRTPERRLSLLVRSALSSNSVETQVHAISTLNTEVNTSSLVDYQGLIPVIIALLSSKSVDVRREVTKLADTLLEQTRSKGKKTVWGLNDLYGEKHTQGLKWLSTTEVQYFLENVLGSTRNECLLDHKVVYGAVARSIHTHGNKGKELSHKTAALHFLASHINHAPIQKIVLKLLLCFDKVEDATSAKTRAVLPALESWISSTEAYQAQCVLELIDPAVVERLLVRQVVAIEHGAGTKLLIELIKQQNDTFGPAAIDWLSTGFSSLKRDTKVELLRALIEAIIDGPSDVSRQAHASVEKLSIPTDLFAQMFSAIELSLPTSRVSTPIKKQRKEAPNEPSAIDIRRFTHLLEILEKSEDKHAALLPLLFSKLGDLILIETESATPVSYTEQILLSCMYPMVDPAKFDPSTCRIDILINCIRTSSSPQVHNRALLLVAALAEAAPEQVLHGVMPIFTFMGANILRQDDGFSAHVIESTIQRVVPPLLKSLGAETQSQVLGAAGILRSFVDAFPHIPKHRRSKLFIVLIRTMGEESFLAPLLAIMAEKRLQISPKPKSGESQKSYLEFALTLLRQCSVKAQLQALLGLVEIARTIPEHIKDIQGTETLLDYNAIDDGHLDRLKASIIAIVGGHFASKKVRSDFEIYASDHEWAHKDLFIGIVESLLKACDNFDDYQAPLEKTLDALDRVITLLPVPLFRIVVHDLLESKRDEYMRIKALDIITGRAASSNPADEPARQSFFALVKQISSIFGPECSSPLLCSAFQSISTIGRKFGKAEPGTFVSVVNLVIGEMGLTNEELIVRVSAIECLTTLVVVLGARILPQLQRFMPIVLDGFAKISRDENADLVPLATVSLLEALVKGIPSFMTPYTQSIMERAVDFSFVTEELASDKRALLSTVAKNMPTRNVLEALGGAWEVSTKTGKKPLMALINVIEETVEHSERKVVTGAAKEILTLFMQALDMRRKSKAWDAKGIEQVEKRVIAALLKVVLKLNDSTFRPLFIKLRDWALSDFADKDPAALQCRRITFFNFFSQFTLTFKSIVLNYFNYVFDDMLEILAAAGELSIVPRRLWIGIVSSFEHGFASDNEDFWRTPDKFDRVAPTLISQLDHAETYPVLLTLIPAIVELTASTPSEDHFKLINTQVLQQFRAEKPAVRLAAVTTENKLSARMGDEWLSMLPQTIPFIAEALEDEDERVEKQTHALAITIESFLGESLDTYLR